MERSDAASSPKGIDTLAGGVTPGRIPTKTNCYPEGVTYFMSKYNGGHMPQSFARVLVQIVFSTKNRFPFLADRDIREELHAYLGGTCNNLGCSILKTGGVEDHVHLLCGLSRILSIADTIAEIKRESSKWIKTKGGLLTKFSWQNGYGVFSVGQSDIERTRAYIENQEEHHRKRTFQEEYRAFLNEYGIAFDERYVWD